MTFGKGLNIIWNGIPNTTPLVHVGMLVECKTMGRRAQELMMPARILVRSFVINSVCVHFLVQASSIGVV